jgi:DNA-binding NtrC family response regulator
VSDSGQPQRKLKIMVVDDEDDIRTMIGEMIETWGHEAILVDKTKDILTGIARGRADLLLLDLNMPGASGLDVLKVLRRRRIQTPTIIVSAHVSADVAQELAELGISGIVAKPFRRERLEAEIKKIFG